jgi:hypothetical protein
MDLLGLKVVAPVPLCFVTPYLPVGDKASGFSYRPAPGFAFCGYIDIVLSNVRVFGLIVNEGDLLFGFMFSYLLGAGNLNGSNGI